MKRLSLVAFAMSLTLRSAGAQQSVVPATNGFERYNPPWHVGPMVPLGPGIRSVEVREHDAPVWLEPQGKRRGSLFRGARLPIYGSRPASGDCKARWFLIGVAAWVCGSEIELRSDEPGGYSQLSSPEGLPYEYYFVGPDGALGYQSRSLVGEGVPESQLEPGFAVALQQIIELRGEKLGYSTNGLWLALADLVKARASAFQGVHAVGSENLDVAWTWGANKPVWNEPNGKLVRRLASRTALHIAERRHHGNVWWLRIGNDEWVRQSDTRAPADIPVPADLALNERWIDVDLKTQVLQARVGTRVVFSTLVSTGRGVGTQVNATPIGEHRIWVKLATSDMSNVEDDTASQYYAIEAVPWVMFFKAGYALHGAFWHDDFGTRRSHGCVNLSPKDAEFVFHWAAPTLPDGWYAVHPTQAEQGTRIRVR